MYYYQRSGLISRKLDEETFILNHRKEQSHSLNHTATWVWEQLEQKREFSSLLEEFINTFLIDEQEARSDLQELLDELMELELVERAN